MFYDSVINRFSIIKLEINPSCDSKPNCKHSGQNKVIKTRIEKIPSKCGCLDR